MKYLMARSKIITMKQSVILTFAGLFAAGAGSFGEAFYSSGSLTAMRIIPGLFGGLATGGIVSLLFGLVNFVVSRKFIISGTTGSKAMLAGLLMLATGVISVLLMEYYTNFNAFVMGLVPVIAGISLIAASFAVMKDGKLVSLYISGALLTFLGFPVFVYYTFIYGIQSAHGTYMPYSAVSMLPSITGIFLIVASFLSDAAYRSYSKEYSTAREFHPADTT